MLQDIRYAIRSYLRAPGFTLVAIVTLALGIGGATAIFSIVDGILLRPLPYPEPEQIVRLSHLTRGQEDAAFAAGDYLDIKRDSTTFESMAGYREDLVDLTGSGDPVRVTGVQTTTGFFDVFKAAPLLGRTYQDAVDHPGDTVAVIGEGLWQRQFGSRADIIGQKVRVNGTPTEIVGVVPEEFRHPLAADIWTLSPRDVPTSPIPITGAAATWDSTLAQSVADEESGVSSQEPGVRRIRWDKPGSLTTAGAAANMQRGRQPRWPPPPPDS